NTPLTRVLTMSHPILMPSLLPLLDRATRQFPCEEAFPVSALTAENCDALVRSILARLPPGPALFPEDTLTDQPERALVSEMIREKILHHTRQEVPHATAVAIERWEDGEDGITRIDAGKPVERAGQKGIVSGR